jgi:hypothetical protein
MSKKNVIETPQDTVVEIQSVEIQPEVKQVTVSELKQLGRPVNPNSVRQVKIQERLLKKEAGLLKRGRPIVGNSKRQETLQKRADKVNSGIDLKPGRPININSKRQIELAKKNNSDVVELIKG